jgi:hypothetical protein
MVWFRFLSRPRREIGKTPWQRANDSKFTVCWFAGQSKTEHLAGDPAVDGISQRLDCGASPLQRATHALRRPGRLARLIAMVYPANPVNQLDKFSGLS